MKKTILFLVLILLFSYPSAQAEMSMKIISRNIQSHEGKTVADNEEINEATEAKEMEGAIEVVDVKEVVGATKTTEAITATVAVEIKKVVAVAETVEAEEIEEEEATDEKKVVGSVGIIEPSVVTETKVVVEEIAAEEAIEKKEVVSPVEIIEPTVTTEIKVVAEAVVTKEVEDAVEVKEAVVVTEVQKVKETTRTEDADPVDYKALGLRSVELNPNDYPDEVITLLEPHKDNENNNSVLFYSSLGLAYKSKGRLKDAIAAYKRALELVPNVPAPAIQYNLGIVYYYNNELPESFKCFLNSSAQRSNHAGTKQWIKQLAGELNIYKVPDTSNLKLISSQKISVNREKSDRESRLRVYLTQNGGRIQELSVKDKIYSYGIDSDTERPVDYIIIDSDGDGNFDNVINTKGKFGVPTWAYNPE